MAWCGLPRVYPPPATRAQQPTPAVPASSVLFCDLLKTECANSLNLNLNRRFHWVTHRPPGGLERQACARHQLVQRGPATASPG